MAELQIFTRGVRGSNLPAATSKLGQLRSPHFACLSEETVKAVDPFYLVSVPGEVKDPMQGNGKTYHRLSTPHRADDLDL